MRDVSVARGAIDDMRSGGLSMCSVGLQAPARYRTPASTPRTPSLRPGALTVIGPDGVMIASTKDQSR